MTELEIKKAQELLALESARQSIVSEISRLKGALNRFDGMIKLLNDDAVWYFEVKDRLEKLFPDDVPTAGAYKLKPDEFKQW